MKKIIGIGEYGRSNKEIDELETHALGTCVGVIAISKTGREIAMAHVALPYKNINPKEALKKPYKYADTVVDYIVEDMKKSYNLEKKDIKILLYGGAVSAEDKDTFKIGEKNISILEQILKNRHIYYEKKSVGGNCARTVIVKKGGLVKLKSIPIMGRLEPCKEE